MHKGCLSFRVNVRKFISYVRHIRFYCGPEVGFLLLLLNKAANPGGGVEDEYAGGCNDKRIAEYVAWPSLNLFFQCHALELPIWPVASRA